MTKEELKILKKEYQEEINLFPIDSLEKQIAINQGEADDYAIEFAEWFVLRYTEEVFYGENYTKELLEIFKKEKGL